MKKRIYSLLLVLALLIIPLSNAVAIETPEDGETAAPTPAQGEEAQAPGEDLGEGELATPTPTPELEALPPESTPDATPPQEQTRENTPTPEPEAAPLEEATPAPLLAENEPEGEAPLDPEILQIAVPSAIDFTMDPLELGGRGQVYSDEYLIENCGEADVLLTITDIGITFANDTDFLALAEPYDTKAGLKSKAIYLTLEFAREGMEPIVLTDGSGAQEISLLLAAQDLEMGNEDSAVVFSVTGNLNPYSSVDWLDGDVQIHLSYRLEILDV